MAKRPPTSGRRSDRWNDDQREAFRAGYHNLTIMTLDHVLERARRIVNLPRPERPPAVFEDGDVPF
jgi:hypothetical protein